MAQEKTSQSRYFDFSLLFIILFLVGFGLVMIYSTSSYSAALTQDGDGLYYLKKQAVSVVIGLIAMIFTSVFPYKLYKKLAPFILGFSIFSVLLILTPLGYEANGAKRWIRIAGLSIQPAEIVKIAVIIFTAYLLSKMTPKERVSFRGLVLSLFFPAVLAAMILVITSNLSSAIIIGGIAYCMLLVSAKKNYRALILLVLAGIIACAAVFVIAKGIGNSIWGYRGERILAWLDPESYADGGGFQILQSLYGIGSGGIWGKGLGKSVQKLGFLPEAQNDMIFSIICEELGLFGGLAIIFMFVLLLWRLRDISAYTTDLFGNLLVAGVFSHLAIQVLLNIAVVTNTIPNTGISLPFISYGGTSEIFLLAEMGIVMNVARNIDFVKTVDSTGEADDEE